MLRVTLLGSGTSTGIPLPTCKCPVCTSDKPRNKRLRSSIHVHYSPDGSFAGLGTVSLIVDTSTDFRLQALQSNLQRVDAVLYTHTHADHILGLDDLRAFNFAQGGKIPVYATETSGTDLLRVFPYAFESDLKYQGGAPPCLTLNTIEPFTSMTFGSLSVLPILLYHGSQAIVGFRFGSFAYLTDCNSIPPESMRELQGLDVLILDGLRIRPHNTHFTQAEALAQIEHLKPRKAYLTHISHEVDHDEGNNIIRTLCNRDVELAYDGLVINIPTA